MKGCEEKLKYQKLIASLHPHDIEQFLIPFISLVGYKDILNPILKSYKESIFENMEICETSKQT